MVELKLILADDDLGYINAIMKYLSSWGKRKFHIVSFTNLELLKEYLSHNQGDILLISPDWITDDIALSGVQVTVLLNATDRLPDPLKDYPSINKYQPGDELGNQLMRIFSEYSEDEVIVSNVATEAMVMGIYSPAGGVGKTTIAVTMARLLAQSQIPTLLLSLEDLASYGSLLQDNLSYNFSDLLYFVKQKHTNLMLKIEGLKSLDEQTGLHYFSPVSCYQDMREVTTEEWVGLITYIREHSIYERIVIDFDTSLGSRNIKLLKMCQQLILVTNEQPLSVYKVEKLFHNFNKMGMDFLHEKASLMVNANTDSQSLELTSLGGLHVTGYIPFDDTMNRLDDHHPLNLNGVLGSALGQYMGLSSSGERDAY